MKTWSFELILTPFNCELEQAADALFESNCDDMLLVMQGPTPILQFDRQDEGLDTAVLSAIKDVRAAKTGASVLRVIHVL